MASVRLRIGETRDIQIVHAKPPATKTGNVHLPVTWDSSDDAIATVGTSSLMNLDGHAASVKAVTGVAAGTATITATLDGGGSSTISVTVTPESSDPLVIQALGSPVHE
jgi:uncharacterized protein YjdB